MIMSITAWDDRPSTADTDQHDDSGECPCCAECRSDQEWRDCPECNGKGGGSNPTWDDPNYWDCGRCEGTGQLAYCTTCGEFADSYE